MKSLKINKIYQGDVLRVLKTWDDEFVDTIITSPPYYGLRDYGVKGQIGLEPTLEEYLNKMLKVTAELKRVLKKKGTLWLNHGDSYATTPSGKTPTNTGNKTARSFLKCDSVPQKCLTLQNFRLVQRMIDEQGWILRNVIIWHKPNCLSYDTKLYAQTQKGEFPQPLKDLVRLDPETVKLWDGKKWNQVEQWIENSNPKDVWRLILANGEEVNCTNDHIFKTRDGKLLSAGQLKEGMMLVGSTFPDIEHKSQFIPDEIGWMVGLYLAEGSASDNGNYLHFASHSQEEDRFRRLQQIARQYDARCVKYEERGNSVDLKIYSKVLSGIIDTYISGNSAKNKHLTTKAWQRNNKFLGNLLDGYLEGDGHWDKENRRYRLGFTRNDFLADDLRTICARLGYKIKLRKRYVIAREKQYPCYDGEIRMITSGHWNEKPPYEIVGILEGKDCKYYDVVLAEEPHLLATHSGLLTHNCMPSSAKDRFTVDFEPVFFFSKNKKYYFERQFEDSKGIWNSAKGFNEEGQRRRQGSKSTYGKDLDQTGRNKRTVWKIPTQPFQEAHFAVFPEKLVETPIKAGCPKQICKKCGKARERIIKKGKLVDVAGDHKTPLGSTDGSKYKKRNEGSSQFVDGKFIAGWSYEKKIIGYTDCKCKAGWKRGIVLDPFMGAGTVARVAENLGRNWIGIELNKKYIKIANKRLRQRSLLKS
jgi:DNA modification methylase